MTMEPGGEEEEVARVYAVRLHHRARREIDAAHARLAEIAGNPIADEWQDGLFGAAANMAYCVEDSESTDGRLLG